MSANNCLENNEVWRAAAPRLPLADDRGIERSFMGLRATRNTIFPLKNIKL